MKINRLIKICLSKQLFYARVSSSRKPEEIKIVELANHSVNVETKEAFLENNTANEKIT